jgi:hypothetical protein
MASHVVITLSPLAPLNSFLAKTLAQRFQPSAFRHETGGQRGCSRGRRHNALGMGAAGKSRFFRNGSCR